MFVVAVRVQLKDGAYSEFREAILKNARASVNEEGCVQFDVCFSEDHTRAFFYEVYKTRADWDQKHHHTDHFKAFAAVAGPLMADKQVDLYERDDSPAS